MSKEESIKEIVDRSLLYDFYGELLTEHQRNIYEALVFEDLSLSEIADEEGISRQGVHDLIKRCNKTLEGYENKLHLVERFRKTREEVEVIKRLALEDSSRDRIIDIADKILEEL